ncbi:FAD-dependent oxidoreductase [Candidatus Babeliales bacterium]|nr:FAD-dependent oxidoreductase [Candidatus Babeliales bacterium]
MVSSKKNKALIIGAGPAGLTAGIELLKTGNFEATVLERDNVIGGLARTTEYRGCRYDIGPHHFITSSEKIETWWKDLMQGDFLEHKRFTRIYYNNHFFNYPLEPINVLEGLSLWECLRCMVSYIRYRLFPIKKVRSFQDWVTNKFGYHLFSIFFKTYTEKVWGIECSQISSDWAAQRISGFSLSKAIFFAFFGRFYKKNKPRTIRDDFYYPSKGAGTLWEKAANWLQSFEGGSVHLNQDVVSLEHDGKKIVAVHAQDKRSTSGVQTLARYDADYFFSTMPLRTLIKSLDPLPPDIIINAANSLQYRGLITVNLIVNKTAICPDHWLYVHEKKVKMGRIGNMNNFSMGMVDHPGHTALSLEYFAFVGEAFWLKTEQELVEIAKLELEKIGLLKADEVLDGMVMKTAEAYPLYDEHYKEHLSTVLNYLGTFSNLELMGRNGLHRYNNMDIAMLSAISAVDKVLEKEKTVVRPVDATIRSSAL